MNPVPADPEIDTAAQFHQIRALRIAYETLTPQEIYLPPADSPLPSLLALRTTHRTIGASKSDQPRAQNELERVEQRLHKEQADLDSAKLINEALQTRISALEEAIQERTQKPQTQVAKEVVRRLKKKKADYDAGTGRLVVSFNQFIDDHLAVMLAAEELGGPVAGESLDVDEANLETGFNTQGNARKAKDTQDGGKRQQRIDQIWGRRYADNGKGQEPLAVDEKAAAAAEMRELTEQLLNSLVEAEGGRSDGYVELARESAAARFLVRSKMAQFHPRDARRLRLVDFGRDLDD